MKRTYSYVIVIGTFIAGLVAAAYQRSESIGMFGLCLGALANARLDDYERDGALK